MSKRQKAVWYFAIIFSMVLFLSESVMSQLMQQWYVETPGNESHQFRGVGISRQQGNLKYISDTITDVVYIYSDDDGDLQINASREIFWYKKNQSESFFVLQTHLNNTLIVGSGNTSIGDTWYFIIRVFDGRKPAPDSNFSF